MAVVAAASPRIQMGTRASKFCEIDAARGGGANGRCGIVGGTKNRLGVRRERKRAEMALAPRNGDPSKIAGPPVALSKLLNADANGSATVKAEKTVDLATHKESSRAADSDAENVSSPRSKEVEVEANDDGAEEVDTPRKRKSPELDVARSIELLASSFLKIERARLEVYRDTERMRAEAEVKKGEMELRRTEIMAKTQLQIARLFAKRLKECVGGNGGSSSQVDTLAKKGENEVHFRVHLTLYRCQLITAIMLCLEFLFYLFLENHHLENRKLQHEDILALICSIARLYSGIQVQGDWPIRTPVNCDSLPLASHSIHVRKIAESRMLQVVFLCDC
uniref:Uncharacterized protein n=1 Tax=Aegilops tauschii TaxID=37682 RepID=M8BKZ7_AEGTA